MIDEQLPEAIMVPPVAIGEAQIVSTNLVETAPAWSSSSTYNLGGEVYSAAKQMVYASKVDNNQNHNPLAADAASFWIPKRPAMKLAMFDGVLGTRATRNANINISLRPGGWNDTIGLFGLTGESVTITALYGATPRTNYLRYSGDADNAAWTTFGCLPWQDGPETGYGSYRNIIYAPDGTASADRLTSDYAGGAAMKHGQSQSVTYAAGAWVFSRELKVPRYPAGPGAQNILLELDNGSSKLRYKFVISSGTGGYGTEGFYNLTLVSAGTWTDIDAGYVALGDGWFRVWMKGVPTTGSAITATTLLLDTGSNETFAAGGYSAYLGIAQLEKAQQMTGAIRTAGAPVTIGGDLVYNQTISLIDDRGINDFWDYCYKPLAFKSDLILTGLPFLSDLLYTVEINGPGEVGCGLMGFGLAETIGRPAWGSRTGITDFSQYDLNQYGSETITRRASAKRGDFPMSIESGRVAALQKRFDALRGVPMMWKILGDDETGQIYGRYKSFEVTRKNTAFNEFGLLLEGRT